MTTVSLAPVAAQQLSTERPESLWADAWKRLRRNRAALISAVFLVAITLATFGAPWIPGLADPSVQDLKLSATPPQALPAGPSR